MIDWVLFVLVLVGIFLCTWAGYREGVEEGWRQAGRWADDLTELRPAARIDEDVTIGRAALQRDDDDLPRIPYERL